MKRKVARKTAGIEAESATPRGTRGAATTATMTEIVGVAVTARAGGHEVVARIGIAIATATEIVVAIATGTIVEDVTTTVTGAEAALAVAAIAVEEVKRSRVRLRFCRGQEMYLIVV